MKSVPNILSLNAGSSTLKASLFRCEAENSQLEPKEIWNKQIEWAKSVSKNDRATVIDSLLQSLWSGARPVIKDSTELYAIGHRVVHGGVKYRQSVELDASIERELSDLKDYAPLHVPLNLEVVEHVRLVVGDNVKQFAVFDTAFHHTLPDFAAAYALPYEYFEQGLRRYGFHGISHQYCSESCAGILKQASEKLQIIICHLGSGCSLSAVREGKSVDTTMGFTPLEGVMMATRSGSVDPGLLLYLVDHRGFTSHELAELLNKKSGLLGIFGKSSGMREIVAAKENDARALLAFEMFVHHVARGLMSMAASLSMPNAIVFTGGIGEHSAEVRSAVLRKVVALGVECDESRNRDSQGEAIISTPGSKITALVIPTREEWQIAREGIRLFQMR